GGEDNRHARVKGLARSSPWCLFNDHRRSRSSSYHTQIRRVQCCSYLSDRGLEIWLSRYWPCSRPGVCSPYPPSLPGHVFWIAVILAAHVFQHVVRRCKIPGAALLPRLSERPSVLESSLDLQVPPVRTPVAFDHMEHFSMRGP